MSSGVHADGQATEGRGGYGQDETKTTAMIQFTTHIALHDTLDYPMYNTRQRLPSGSWIKSEKLSLLQLAIPPITFPPNHLGSNTRVPNPTQSCSTPSEWSSPHVLLDPLVSLRPPHHLHRIRTYLNHIDIRRAS